MTKGWYYNGYPKSCRVDSWRCSYNFANCFSYSVCQKMGPVMSTPAKRRANSRWAAKNRDKTRIYSLRSTAKRYIRDYATAEDLEDFKRLLDNRAKELELSDQ